MNKHYLIYKTTNTVNSKYYIGKHETFNLKDGYLGSGVALKEAIKKYGREKFKCEILYDCATREEMNEKEKEIVTEEFIKNPLVYNLTIGGEGGPAFLGKKHTENTKQKLREYAKAHPENYVRTSEQLKEIAKKANKTKLERGLIYSEEERKQKKLQYKMCHKLSEDEKERRRVEANLKRSLTMKSKHIHRTAEQKEHLRNINLGKTSPTKNKIYIYNEELKQHKFVRYEDLNKYLNSGWTRVKKKL